MNSKTLSSRARFVCAAVAVAALPSTVSAQQFDVQQFRPAASQTTNAFTVHSAEILTNGEWELGLVLNYANDPLIVRRSDTQTLRFGDVVSEQLALDILGAVGIARFLEIGFDIPLILVQTGDRVDGVDGATGAQGGFGVGTVRVVPAITFFDRSRDGGAGPALGIVADLLLPTGSEEDWQGEGFRANPQLAFDYALSSGLRLSLNAGAMFRPQSDLLSNLNVGNQFTWGVAVDAPVALDDALRVIGEVHGAAGLTADDLAVEELPTELLLGVRYVSEAGAAVEAGGGTGLIGGAGSPDFRLFVGVGYAGGADPDRDDDGFPNSEDACPLEAEDFDEYRDGDGCPDVDNDEDGIRDTIDECPLDPEDKDDFEDLDGCPDPDNDGDGIIDVRDECPLEPEDVDQFEDVDGCPDPDNDEDGILDVNDSCPNQPEDVDDFEDADGCPDPDNDRDGKPDVDDPCPNVPEDFDGVEDEDGCPEEGEGLVSLTCDAIEIRESVYFDTDSDVIQRRSYPLLDQIAGVLRGASYIRLVRVEGNTDDRGSDEHNLDLSNRRAASVRTYLTNAGIDAARLDSIGYGESRPIAENTTSEGRATNRRVDFRIVEQDNTCGQ